VKRKQKEQNESKLYQTKATAHVNRKQAISDESGNIYETKATRTKPKQTIPDESNNTCERKAKRRNESKKNETKAMFAKRMRRDSWLWLQLFFLCFWCGHFCFWPFL
jgi:hypothetical protein